MKKNYQKLGITIIIGFILLATSTFMSLANGQTGYDSFKQVLKNKEVCEFENGTVRLKASVKDNGKTLANIDSTIKADEKSNLMSATIDLKADGLNKNFELYTANDSAILKEKASSQYLKFICPENSCNKFEGLKMHHDPEKNNNDHFTQTHELILDAIVGDYKKNFTEKSLGNGNKEINFTLSENEVPELVNTLLSLKEEDTNKENAKKQLEECNELNKMLGIDEADIKLPELQSDIKVKNINLKLTLNSKNQVNGFGLTLEVKGKDSAKKIHNLKVNINAQTENLGATKVDTINLEGKDVKIIENEDLKKFDCELND